MLEDPITIGGASFEMPDCRGKVALPKWLGEALASDPHDAACRRPNILPFSMPHWIEVDLAQEGFGQSREISQCLRVNLSRHHAAGLDCRGIQREGTLNLNPFGQEIRLKFPLHDDLPLFRRSSRGNTDEDDHEHEHKVGHPSLISDELLVADAHRNASRRWKNYSGTLDIRQSVHMGQAWPIWFLWLAGSFGFFRSSNQTK